MRDTFPTVNSAREPTIELLLVDARQAAVLLSISIATFWRWESSGELGPPGTKKVGRRLWALAELRDWVGAGMPRRETWLALLAQRNGRPV
ncbi:MAG TPA: hypothetical protein VNX28_04855 [Gemmataceae bacterium]|jgi:hypothetical protein|nr:hypothetical protein [Gemmataceae bacterium]